MSIFHCCALTELHHRPWHRETHWLGGGRVPFMEGGLVRFHDGWIIIVDCWMALQRTTWTGFLLVPTLVVRYLDLCIGG
ncbi:unnamed protein product [Linum tenue]|uniref:Uncharacterized protein n=1 Tax=Linum tenue TaxID=586396 RepID=A0AAV0HW50_9ROSI|nr:unnamed protein product [Linum tenue]